MRYLKKYKLFESDEEDIDENEKVPSGFKYSWNDVEDILLYLTDNGFEIDKHEAYYVNKKGEKITNYASIGSLMGDNKIKDIKWGIYDVQLSKKTDSKKITKKIRSNYISSNDQYLYLDSDIKSINDIYEEISSICNHFDRAYQNLDIDSDSYNIYLMLATSISDEFITDTTNKDKENQTSSSIEEFFSAKSSDVLQFGQKFTKWSSSNKYSKRFKDLAFKNKLGEYSWNFKGSIKEGFLVHFINDTSLTAGVKKTNYPKLPTRDYNEYGIKVTFRKVTNDDLEKLAKMQNVDISYVKDRYEGIMGIFFEFDYNKLYKIVRDMVENSVTQGLDWDIKAFRKGW